MAKLPSIDVNPDVAGPAGQQRADLEDFVPGWRQVDSAIRQSGDAAQSIYQGGEAAALAQQRAALETGKIGEAIQNITDPLEKRWKQTDLSSQQVAASRLHMAWAKNALDRIKTGDVHDPNLADGFLEDFDKNTSDVVNNAATPEGKLYLTHALAEMRAQFGTQVILGQSERAGQQIKKDALELVNNRSETARVNPAMTPQLLADHKRDMLNTVKMLGGSQEQAEEMIATGNKSISVAAIEGEILTNPQVVKQQLALPLEKRDPIFKAASPYIGGEIGNTLARNADSRIKNNESEARQKLVLARQEEQRGRERQAGSILNAINAKQPDVNGVPIKDAIAKLAASGGGFHLGDHLSNVFKASGLDGTEIAGDSSTFLRIKQNIAQGNTGGWTASKLQLLVGHRDKTGVPDGLDESARSMLEGQLDRLNKPEKAMDDTLLHAALRSAESAFKDPMLVKMDQSGFVASKHQQYIIDTTREYYSRTENGERGVDILDQSKPNSLATRYQKYLPTFRDVMKANSDFAQRKKVDPVEVAKAQGLPDPESYSKIAVKVDPRSPAPLLGNAEDEDTFSTGIGEKLLTLPGEMLGEVVGAGQAALTEAEQGAAPAAQRRREAKLIEKLRSGKK